MGWKSRARRWYRSIRNEEALFALRIAVGYLLLGAAWIVVSDRVLAALVEDPGRFLWLETVKGWAFVLGTSLLLYLLLRISLRSHRKLGRRVEESERFLDTLIQNLPGVVYACANDPQWTMTYLSPEVERLTGYSPDELLDNELRSYASLIHEEDRERVWEEVQAAVEDRRPFRLEYRIRTREGGTRWVWEQGRAVYGEDGEPIQLEGVNLDVTDRRRAKEEVERQVRRLRSLRSIDLAIMGSLDLDITLDVVLDQATAILEVDAAAILTFDPDAQRLACVAGRGFRTTLAARRPAIALGEGPAGRAALERRTVRVKDLRRPSADPEETALPPCVPEEGFVAYCAIPLVAQGKLRGVLELFHRERLDPDDSWLEFLDTLAGQTAIGIDNARLFEELERANLELRVAYDQTIEGWARALDLRDDETEGHSRRVTALSVALAQRMGIRGEELVNLRRGALLHDMGKLAIPDRILLKPGKLTDEEWEVMRRHPVYARDLLAPVPFLRRAIEIPYCHHEKWDGSGYPRGLEGEDIPLGARVFAVADVWDALTSDRPYRKAWPSEKARAHIREQAGKHFDPEVVEVFLSLDFDELAEIAANGDGGSGVGRLGDGSPGTSFLRAL